MAGPMRVSMACANARVARIAQIALSCFAQCEHTEGKLRRRVLGRALDIKIDGKVPGQAYRESCHFDVGIVLIFFRQLGECFESSFNHARRVHSRLQAVLRIVGLSHFRIDGGKSHRDFPQRFLARVSGHRVFDRQKTKQRKKQATHIDFPSVYWTRRILIGDASIVVLPNFLKASPSAKAKSFRSSVRCRPPAPLQRCVECGLLVFWRSP